MSQPLEGIYVALTTPFVGDEISTERLRQNIARYNQTNLAGFLVLGSTGECVSLSDQESERAVETVVEAAAPGKRILVGTARESTKGTVDFTRRVAGNRISAALVRPPSYFKSSMTRAALKRHYLALAEASLLPILIYNIPQNTGISLEPDLVTDLAAHPNIIGLKESSGSLGFLAEVVPNVPPSFHYFLGSGHVIYPGLEMGASGAILAVANAAPELCAEIFTLFKQGKKDQARQRQLDLIPLNKALMQTHGIAGLKAAQDLRGYYGGPARAPLLPASEAGRQEIAAIMKNLGLIKP